MNETSSGEESKKVPCYIFRNFSAMSQDSLRGLQWEKISHIIRLSYTPFEIKEWREVENAGKNARTFWSRNTRKRLFVMSLKSYRLSSDIIHKSCSSPNAGQWFVIIKNGGRNSTRSTHLLFEKPLCTKGQWS